MRYFMNHGGSHRRQKNGRRNAARATEHAGDRHGCALGVSCEDGCRLSKSLCFVSFGQAFWTLGPMVVNRDCWEADNACFP